MQLKGSYYREDPRDFSPLLTLPNNIRSIQSKTTQYNGGVTFGYPLLLTQKSQINLTGGFDYTDRRMIMLYRPDYRARPIVWTPSTNTRVILRWKWVSTVRINSPQPASAADSTSVRVLMRWGRYRLSP